jgi:hypothetical protein
MTQLAERLERLTDLLDRLPPPYLVRGDKRGVYTAAPHRRPDDHFEYDPEDPAPFYASLIMWAVRGEFWGDDPKSRDPIARRVTEAAAVAYQALTGRRVTRSSKAGVKGGHQREGGGFAEFLGEVFRILAIEASPTGQTRLLMNRNRR